MELAVVRSTASGGLVILLVVPNDVLRAEKQKLFLIHEVFVGCLTDGAKHIIGIVLGDSLNGHQVAKSGGDSSRLCLDALSHVSLDGGHLGLGDGVKAVEEIMRGIAIGVTHGGKEFLIEMVTHLAGEHGQHHAGQFGILHTLTVQH